MLFCSVTIVLAGANQDCFLFFLVIGFKFAHKVYNVKEYEKVVVEVELTSGEISEPVTVE